MDKKLYKLYVNVLVCIREETKMMIAASGEIVLFSDKAVK